MTRRTPHTSTADVGGRIAFIHSNADFLVGPRLPLLRHLRTRGDVVALAPGLEARHERRLSEIGVTGVPIRLDATGMNPIRDVLDTIRLVRTLRSLRPTLVITNTIKPVTFGTFAATMAGVARRYALLSGLGYAFTEDGRRRGPRKRLVRSLARLLYRWALARNERVVFHNPDDLREVVNAGLCPPDKASWVAGSGVDTHAFPVKSGAPGPTFVMVARLLVEKGVREYLEAARAVKSRMPEAQFLLVGQPDANPSAMAVNEVQPYVDDGTVTWPGAVEDVRPWLARASIFVLPSYREGSPKSTLEALSTGLAVITTDVPGCRDTVPDGANGILVPVRDTVALASAMERLGRDLPLVAVMGGRSRALAESVYEESAVHRQLDALLGLSAAGVSEQMRRRVD